MPKKAVVVHLDINYMFLKKCFFFTGTGFLHITLLMLMEKKQSSYIWLFQISYHRV